MSYLREVLAQWLQWAPRDGCRSTDFATLGALKSAISEAGLRKTAAALKL